MIFGQPRSVGSRLTRLAAVALLTATALSACGGGDDSAAKERALENARAEGRAEAVAEQRAKKTAQDTAALRRELRELRKAQKQNGGGPSSKASRNGGGGGTAASAGSGTDDCGAGITVNSATTSCAFGREVRASYYASGQAGVIEAFSPATGKSYTLTCSGSTMVVCRGGNNAEVRFR